MIIIKKIYYYFIKIFILLILFIITIYLLKNNTFNIKNIIFKDNIDYSYFRSKTNYLLGKIFNNKDSFVSSSKLEYKNIIKENNSFKFETDYNYILNNLYPGIVIFIGEKEKLGNTIIINGDNGINYWYSNLENINVKLYDYVNKDTILGSVINNYFYLTLIKDEKYLNYEEYI